LMSGLRRACNLIEELGRREDFYLDLAGGSSRSHTGAVFHNAHLPYKLPCANRAEKDGVAIEVPEYVDGTAEEAKHTVRRISLSEEDMPFSEVRANHCGPLNWQRGADPGKLDCSHRLRGRQDAHGQYRRNLTPSQSEEYLLTDPRQFVKLHYEGVVLAFCW